jgi:hypothetical protein
MKRQLKLVAVVVIVVVFVPLAAFLDGLLL